jgi:hypothetical protein
VSPAGASGPPPAPAGSSSFADSVLPSRNRDSSTGAGAPIRIETLANVGLCGDPAMSSEPISPELALIDPRLANNSPRKAGLMIAPYDSENAPSPGANGSTAPEPPSVEGLLFAAGAISADQLGEVVRDAVLSDRPVAAVAVERGFVTREALAELLHASGSQTSLAEALGEAEVPALVVEAAPAAPVAVEEGPARTVFFAVQPAAPEPQAVSAMPAQVPLPAMSVVQQAVAAAANGAAPVEPAPVAVVPASEPVLEIVPEPVAEEPAVAVAEPILAVAEPVQAMEEPALEVVPAPEPPLEVALPVQADAPAAAVASFAVSVRLESGERVAVGTSDSFERATELARGLVETLSTTGEWPFVSGRFIRPAGIVSIDIERALGD